MKTALILLWLAACAHGVYVDDATQAKTLNEHNDQSPGGGFHYGIETSNGITSQVDGEFKPSHLDKNDVALEVHGSSGYESPEGEVIRLVYVANENGFQPEGAHLPTPPPTQAVPEYILRSLEFIKAHPYQEKA